MSFRRGFRHAVSAMTIAVFALTVRSAFADQPSEAPTAGTPLVVRPAHPVELQPESPSSRLGIKLGVGLLVVAGGLWVVKRRRGVAELRPRTLTISARKAIGVRSELLVVDVDGLSLLLGVTPGSIQRLAILPDPTTVAAGLEESDDIADEMAEPGFELPRDDPRGRAPRPPAPAISPPLRGDRDRRVAAVDRERDRERPVPLSVRPAPLSARPAPEERRSEPSPPRLRAAPAKEGGQLERQIRGLMRNGRPS